MAITLGRGSQPMAKLRAVGYRIGVCWFTMLFMCSVGLPSVSMYEVKEMVYHRSRENEKTGRVEEHTK